MIDGKQCIWLQRYGWCEAKPAGEFKVGEFMRWNFGSVSKILAVTSETAKTVSFLLEWKGHQQYVTGGRKFRTGRLVAIGSGAYY